MAVDKSNRVRAFSMGYYVDKKDFKSIIDGYYEVMNDASYKESVRKYSQHRFAVCRNWLHLYDTYRMEKLYYLETVFLHPELRGARGQYSKIQNRLNFAVCEALEHGCGLIVEGMWTISNYMKYRPPSMSWAIGDSGEFDLTLIERTVSYDGYVIPVFFRAPKIVSRL